MKIICFVCTGNTCRSPMAEYLFNQKIKNIPELNQNYLAISAGIFAQENSNISKNSLDVLAKNNIDASSFKSTKINQDLINTCDLILTMTSTHKNLLLDCFEFDKNNIFILNQYINNNLENLDIVDPYGGNIQDYLDCAKDISNLINKLINKINK